MLSKSLRLMLGLLCVFLMACSGVNADEKGAEPTAGESQKPGDSNEQIRERTEKTKARQLRTLVELKSITPLAVDSESLALRIGLQINGKFKTGTLALNIKPGQAQVQDKSSWLEELDRRSGTSFEVIVYRMPGDGVTGTAGVSFTMRKQQTGALEKVSAQLAKISLGEQNGLPQAIIEKLRFEFPAKTDLRKWLNE